MLAMTTLLRPSILALAAILAVIPSPASAQTDAERAGARAAGLAGLEAYSAGKYEQALDYFGRAESVVHAPTHQLYLARANAKLGYLVSAREFYLKLTQERLPASASKPFRDAQAAGDKELAELEPRLPYVSVVLQGAKATDIQVTRDGEVLPPALIGVPHPEDPGTHTFKASATAMESAPTTITLKEGVRETVTLTLVAVPGAASEAPAAGAAAKGSAGFSADSEPEASNSKGPGLRIAGYSGIGLGAVGIGIGTYFLIKSSSTQTKADDLYHSCEMATPTNPCDQAAVESTDQRASDQRTVGIVSTVAGGAFLTTGIILLVVDASGSHTAEPQAAGIQPVFGLNYAGLSGRF